MKKVLLAFAHALVAATVVADSSARRPTPVLRRKSTRV